MRGRNLYSWRTWDLLMNSLKGIVSFKRDISCCVRGLMCLDVVYVMDFVPYSL
jgi:hypothetical protein